MADTFTDIRPKITEFVVAEETIQKPTVKDFINAKNTEPIGLSEKKLRADEVEMLQNALEGMANTSFQTERKTSASIWDQGNEKIKQQFIEAERNKPLSDYVDHFREDTMNLGKDYLERQERQSPESLNQQKRFVDMRNKLLSEMDIFKFSKGKKD